METLSRSLLTFLLNALWQVPTITLIALVARRLMRNGPAAHRHAVWIAALVAAVVLPFASIRGVSETQSFQLTVAYAPQSAGPATAGAIGTPAQPQAPQRRSIPFPQLTAALLLAVYAGFILFRCAKLARAWRRTVQIRRCASTQDLSPAIAQAWTRCLRAFGLDDVELLFSPNLHAPVTMGVGRSAVILPDSMRAETSDDVLTTAMGHELAHITRHDFALSLLYELLYLPVSFHPAAWIIRRGIEETRELACDELVTRELIDAGVYARSIVSIARSVTVSEPAGYTLGIFDGDILEQRIRRLLEHPYANRKRARLLLATGLAVLAVTAVLVSGVSLTAFAQSTAQGEMKMGESAYNSGDFNAAIQHFEQAVRADSSSIKAKFFLCEALYQQFLIEKASPDSPLMTRARQQYQDVLASEPANKLAAIGMMVVAVSTRQHNEAHDWALKVLQLDPKEKTAWYTAAVMDWAIVYPEFDRVKKEAGGKMQDYFIPDDAARENLRNHYLPLVEEGKRMLRTALELDPGYEDAMAYTNLLYRLEAAMVDSPSEAAELIAKADEWVGKALAAKKQRSEAAARPPHLEVDGPLQGPSRAVTVVVAPPPPPPPPPGAEPK